MRDSLKKDKKLERKNQTTRYQDTRDTTDFDAPHGESFVAVEMQRGNREHISLNGCKVCNAIHLKTCGKFKILIKR